MFGWIIGTVGIVALVATIKRRRFARYGYPGMYYGPRRGLRGRGLLRGLFWQLETTPGQENAIVAALDEALERLRSLKADTTTTRRELGALIGSQALDRAALEALIGRQRTQLDAASAELVRTVERVHEVLDDSQRRELGALIAEGSLGPTMVRGCASRHYGPAYGF
ncbi:MAG TPA: periplasmic heavy metal sensor [Polyangiales bacterium]|nr:periplasmic heavy metal sensor [Polyangiales bacterium]